MREWVESDESGLLFPIGWKNHVTLKILKLLSRSGCYLSQYLNFYHTLYLVATTLITAIFWV